jgi:hypothetical protein
MRLARTLFALAALATAAACSEGASGITAPVSVSRESAPGGGWIGSGNVAPTDSTGRGGTWIGTGNLVTSEESAQNEGGGGWAGSGNVVAPSDSTKDGRGGWIGSGN